jgi:hypothetical protein
MPHPERLTLHTRGNKLNRKLPSTSGAARSLSDGASNWLQRGLQDTTVEMFQQMTEIMDDNTANECRGRVLLRNRVVPGSNLGPETGYSEGVRGFPQSLQANAGILP